VIIDVKIKMEGSLGSYFCRGRRGRGRMVFGFITTCTISATNVGRVLFVFGLHEQQTYYIFTSPYPIVFIIIFFY
jgi:hypothetical protein